MSDFTMFVDNGTVRHDLTDASDVYEMTGKAHDVPLVLLADGSPVSCWCGANAHYVRDASCASNAGFVCMKHVYDFSAGMYPIHTV